MLKLIKKSLTPYHVYIYIYCCLIYPPPLPLRVPFLCAPPHIYGVPPCAPHTHIPGYATVYNWHIELFCSKLNQLISYLLYIQRVSFLHSLHSSRNIDRDDIVLMRRSQHGFCSVDYVPKKNIEILNLDKNWIFHIAYNSISTLICEGSTYSTVLLPIKETFFFNFLNFK